MIFFYYKVFLYKSRRFSLIFQSKRNKKTNGFWFFSLSSIIQVQNQLHYNIQIKGKIGNLEIKSNLEKNGKYLRINVLTLLDDDDLIKKLFAYWHTRTWWVSLCSEFSFIRNSLFHFYFFFFSSGFWMHCRISFRQPVCPSVHMSVMSLPTRPDTRHLVADGWAGAVEQQGH